MGELAWNELGFLMALADMIPAGTRQWRDTWPGLAARMKRKDAWWIRQMAYRLKKRGFVEIRLTGKGFILTMTPDKSGVIQHTQESGEGVSFNTPMSGVIQHTVDKIPSPPLTIPPPVSKGNAPQKTPSVSGLTSLTPRGAEEVETQKAAPLVKKQVSPEKPKPALCSACQLSASDKISAEKEIGRLIHEIDRVRDRHDAVQDWTDTERANVRRWKARVDELCVKSGIPPVYKAPP